jgi:hypothetical protein
MWVLCEQHATAARNICRPPPMFWHCISHTQCLEQHAGTVAGWLPSFFPVILSPL